MSIDNIMSSIDNIAGHAISDAVKLSIDNVAEPEKDTGNPNAEQLKEDDADKKVWETELRECQKLVQRSEKRKYSSELPVSPWVPWKSG